MITSKFSSRTSNPFLSAQEPLTWSGDSKFDARTAGDRSELGSVDLAGAV